MSASSSDSPYSRLSYRRLIAWPERIAREEPFLLAELDRASRRSVLDLGCGTGEHARHLASLAIPTVGIDRSEAQIEAAREYEGEFGDHGPRFILGAVEDLASSVEGPFGMALALGNVLPHFDDGSLRAMLSGLAAVLAPGSRFVSQIVNYERILSGEVRHLPLNFRPAPTGTGEIVFLRLVVPDGERHVKFFPSTLTLEAGADPPLAVQTSKEVRLRAWRLGELETELGQAGFDVDGIYGDIERRPFVPETSSDLVVTAVLIDTLGSTEKDELMKIADRCILVTGAGSGLGEATARALVDRGAAVVIADIDQENGMRVADDLGERARFAPTDVSQEDSVAAAIEAAREAFGALAGAVSCAGIGPPSKVLGKEGPHSLELFERIIRVNLIGTFNVLRLAAEVLASGESDEEGERGVIVNTASVAAFEGQVGQAAYAASKGGVVGLTLPSARELARYGVRVVTVAPGLFDTPLLAGLPEKARQSLGEQVPFPSRLGRPEEFAALVVHVIENRMINGEIIRLDGALRMAPR